MKTTNLKEHKHKKKLERMIKDIDGIITVFDVTTRALAFFKNYVAVQEIISIITTNATILQMQQRKMKLELDEMKGET